MSASAQETELHPPQQTVDLTEEHPEIYASIGIHPCDAHQSTVSDVEALVARNKVVAVGETGFDFFHQAEHKSVQEKRFRDQISLAKNFHKPLIIHCRDALKETIALLKECRAHEVGGVFHCYAETAETAKLLADLDFRVSLTGILTFKNATKLREEVAQIPIEQIMLETDCPYMAPEPHRGKPSEPAHVRQIAEKLAEIKELDLSEVTMATEATAEAFFKFTRT